MRGGKGVATGGFCFEKVEGGRATLHDNREGKSFSRVWFTEVQALLTRGKVRGHHGSHSTTMVVSIVGLEIKVDAMNLGDADVRI
jgi:hypothetical protein